MFWTSQNIKCHINWDRGVQLKVVCLLIFLSSLFLFAYRRSLSVTVLVWVRLSSLAYEKKSPSIFRLCWYLNSCLQGFHPHQWSMTARPNPWVRFYVLISCRTPYLLCVCDHWAECFCVTSCCDFLSTWISVKS